jgi:antitoxin PrlF
VQRALRFDDNAFLHYYTYYQSRDCEDITMTTLTVTARGQVTFRKDVLQHLGIKPGEQIDFDKLPGGELRIRVARPTGSINGFLGLLAGKTKKVASIEEMNEAAAAGWAGEK